MSIEGPSCENTLFIFSENITNYQVRLFGFLVIKNNLLQSQRNNNKTFLFVFLLFLIK